MLFAAFYPIYEPVESGSSKLWAPPFKNMNRLLFSCQFLNKFMFFMKKTKIFD